MYSLKQQKRLIRTIGKLWTPYTDVKIKIDCVVHKKEIQQINILIIVNNRFQ